VQTGINGARLKILFSSSINFPFDGSSASEEISFRSISEFLNNESTVNLILSQPSEFDEINFNSKLFHKLSLFQLKGALFPTEVSGL
jgi:hypothetical protein